MINHFIPTNIFYNEGFILQMSDFIYDDLFKINFEFARNRIYLRLKR